MMLRRPCSERQWLLTVPTLGKLLYLGWEALGQMYLWCSVGGQACSKTEKPPVAKQALEGGRQPAADAETDVEADGRLGSA